jgi:hypothetical protein
MYFPKSVLKKHNTLNAMLKSSPRMSGWVLHRAWCQHVRLYFRYVINKCSTINDLLQRQHSGVSSPCRSSWVSWSGPLLANSGGCFCNIYFACSSAMGEEYPWWPSLSPHVQWKRTERIASAGEIVCHIGTMYRTTDYRAVPWIGCQQGKAHADHQHSIT